MTISAINTLPGATLNLTTTTKQAYNPDLHQPGTDNLQLPPADIDGPEPSKPGKRFQPIVGKNLKGVKQGDHFAFTWDFGPDKGGKQTGVFNTDAFDVALGKALDKTPRKFRQYVGIIDKQSGMVEFYEPTSQGPVYHQFNPATGELTQSTDAPMFEPQQVSQLRHSKRINLDG